MVRLQACGPLLSIVFWRLEAVVERGNVHWHRRLFAVWFLVSWLFTLQYWLVFWHSLQKTRVVTTWSHLAGNWFSHAELIGVLNLSSQMIASYGCWGMMTIKGRIAVSPSTVCSLCGHTMTKPPEANHCLTSVMSGWKLPAYGRVCVRARVCVCVCPSHDEKNNHCLRLTTLTSRISIRLHTLTK